MLSGIRRGTDEGRACCCIFNIMEKETLVAETAKLRTLIKEREAKLTKNAQDLGLALKELQKVCPPYPGGGHS